jgi:hypothetical protein
MIIIKNNTGSKSVKISMDATNAVRAMYCQHYTNEEQLLQSKTFSTIKNAEKWANKVLLNG